MFAADTPSLGSELWISDGTPAGTQLLADIAPGPADSEPRTFVKYRGRAWFIVDPGDLWSTDGTVSGTRFEFSLSTTGQSLFDAAPQIDANGSLTFAPRPGASGTAQVPIVAQDSTNGSRVFVMRLIVG